MIQTLERWRVPLLFLLTLALLGGLALLVLDRPGERPRLEIVLPTPTPVQQIKVYVTGAVVAPGVYGLQAGARVEDALRAAGGARPEADLLRVNLAVLLRDETHLHVPAQGETSPLPPVSTQSKEKININTASAALLDTLPGIGEVRAKKIVEYRAANGPFRRIEDLKELRLIPSSVFEQIKDRISVE